MGLSLGDIFIYFRGDTAPVESAMSTLESNANGWASRVGSVVQGAFSFLIGGMLQAGISNLTNAFQQSAIGMNASLETTTLQFKTLMGDMDTARDHVAMLFEFAKNTPFETQPIINASLKLQTFGGAALNTQENLTRLGNAASAVNAPLDSLGFWMGRLYSSVQGGRPFGEASAELQNLAVISDDVRTKMENMQKSGKSADDIWKVFTDHLDGFQGAMEAQAATWTGLTSTLMDSVSMLGADIFAPFFQLAKDGLGELVQGFSTPMFDQFKTSATEAMQTAADWIRSLAQEALPMLMRAWEVLGPAVQAVGEILSGVGQIISTVADAAYSWGSDLIAQYSNGIYAGVGWVVDALQYIAGVVTSWLEPHSPPKILPNVDKWGGAVAKMYMSGWEDPSLFQTLSNFGKMAGETIQNMFDMGKLGDSSVPELLLGTQGAMADALEQLRTTGDVSEDSFQRIAAAAGGAGSDVANLARQYVQLARANQQVTDAQRDLDDVSGSLSQAQDALALAAMRGDQAGISSARTAQEEMRQRKNQAQARRDQANQEARAAQAKLQQEQQVMDFQKEQISLLRQMVQEQEKANQAAAAKSPKKKGETEEEKNARLAKEAQDRYNYSLLDTEGKLDSLRARQAKLGPGQAEYWQLASQIHELEQTRAREIETNSKKEAAEAEKVRKQQEALKQAQWDHAYAIADTATRLQMMKDRLATLNPEQTEYFSTLTQIANLEKQLEREREAADKKAKGGAGGAGGKGKGGAKPGGGAKPPSIPRAPRGPKGGGAEARDDAPASLEGMRASVDQIMDNIAASVRAGIPRILQAYLSSIPRIMDAARETVNGFVLGLIAQWPTLNARFLELAGQIIIVLQQNIPRIVEAFGRWAAAAVDWLTLAIPQLSTVSGQYANFILGWIRDSGPQYAIQLLEWAAMFVAWVIPATGKLLMALGGLLADMVIWLINAEPKLTAGLLKWGDTFWMWIQNRALPQLFIWLNTLAQQIFQWLNEQGAKLTADDSVSGGLIKGFQQIAAPIYRWFNDTSDKIFKWLNELGPKAMGWAEKSGGSIVQGLWDGVKKKWDEFWRWWQDKLSQLRNSLPFSEPKDPRSPLRGLAKSGRSIVEMLQGGMASAGPLQVPQLSMSPQRLAGAAGGSGAGDMHFHAPLVGNATIRSDQDIVDLAYQVAKVIRKKQA